MKDVHKTFIWCLGRSDPPHARNTFGQIPHEALIGYRNLFNTWLVDRCKDIYFLCNSQTY